MKIFIQLTLRLLIVCGFYQLSRILFYLINKTAFTKVGLLEFIGGSRFDLSAIFYTNALIIILSLIPFKFIYNKIYQRILFILFIVINAVFITTNFIDIVYYNFTGRRSSFALITASGMKDDVVRLIPSFVKQYYLVLLAYIIFIFLFYKVASYTNKIILKRGNIFISILLLLLGIASIILAGRGGIQEKTLNIVDAITYTNSSANTSVVLNTPFTIIKTFNKKDEIGEYHYFSEDEISKIYNPVISLKSTSDFKKKNIVIIILESFGKESINLEFEGRKLTPFLDSLIQESRYFNNAFANGRKSIDAVPSTITSIPSLMENSYISSAFSVNKVDGFTKVLKENGYNTNFFHGAFNGSQNFDQFSEVAGFDKYFGENEYTGTDDRDFDHKWGVFDEKFLQFASKAMSSLPQPFFSTIFTISSHNPYTIPDEYKNKFPKGNRTIHESIAYSDYSLKKFFEIAKKEPWYNETVFILTSDHTNPESPEKKKPYFRTNIAQYSIPILIFDPSNADMKEVNPKLFSQVDILPEILSYLNYSGNILSYGNASDAFDRIVANYNEGLYRFMINDYYIQYDGKNIIEAYKYKEDSLLQKKLLDFPKKELETKIHAYLQQYNNRIISNQAHL